jgi:hypothetical protein
MKQRQKYTHTHSHKIFHGITVSLLALGCFGLSSSFSQAGVKGGREGESPAISFREIAKIAKMAGHDARVMVAGDSPMDMRSLRKLTSKLSESTDPERARIFREVVILNQDVFDHILALRERIKKITFISDSEFLLELEENGESRFIQIAFDLASKKVLKNEIKDAESFGDKLKRESSDTVSKFKEFLAPMNETDRARVELILAKNSKLYDRVVGANRFTTKIDISPDGLILVINDSAANAAQNSALSPTLNSAANSAEPSFYRINPETSKAKPAFELQAGLEGQKLVTAFIKDSTYLLVAGSRSSLIRLFSTEEKTGVPLLHINVKNKGIHAMAVDSLGKLLAIGLEDANGFATSSILKIFKLEGDLSSAGGPEVLATYFDDQFGGPFKSLDFNLNSTKIVGSFTNPSVAHPVLISTQTGQRIGRHLVSQRVTATKAQFTNGGREVTLYGKNGETRRFDAQTGLAIK